MKLQNTKLVLGTVQLGLKYGLNNTLGQPTQVESFAILDRALASGINTFDTAWAYGTAEDVIGAWIKQRSLAGKVNIISKMKPHALNDYPDGTKSSDIVEMEFEKSLKRLGVDSLDGYLFHSPHYVYLNHVVEGLKKIKKSGLVKNIGVSVYDESEALQAANLGVDYIQVPYNAFDQRLDVTDFFDLAKKNKVTVFARSPFLQGLLLMKPNELPIHLSYLRPHLEKFIAIATKYNLTPTEASLNFVHAECRADYIVFGVDNPEQLSKDVNIIKSFSNNNSFISEMRESFKDLNKGAINPSLWSKIKR
ncbi:MAG: aldo/keto reductase [Candidatus Paceibacterota bacterium]|jgi:aryl-alcohol dehydrogenase-like predicted oxidoreductase